MVEGILVGFVLFILTSVTAYVFKIKQLYVSSRKLYGESALSKKGSLSEIVIANHGNQTEENIKVILSPDITCELIASPSTDIRISSENIISLDRLHAKTMISLLVLVEKEELKNSEILEITSADHKGSVIDTIANIPPNFGQIAIILFTIVLFIVTFFYIPKVYNLIEQSIIEQKYETVLNNGWENISRYTSSDLVENYSKQEFPIRYLDQNISENIISFSFEVINKSSAPLEVILSTDDEYQILQSKTQGLYQFDSIIELNYINEKVEPLTKKRIVLKVKKKEQKDLVKLNLTMRHGEELIYDITKKIKIKETF